MSNVPGFIVGGMNTRTGWETQSPYEAMSWHIVYWFASRRSQGMVLGNVPSFYYLWKTYGENRETMVEQTDEALKSYFSELFSGLGQVSTQVGYVNVEGELNNYHLNIAVRVNYNGRSYDLARTVLVTGEKYKLLDEARL